MDTPEFLSTYNNNRAHTVLELFREAVTIYGLPSRIGIDKGGENVDVAMYLLTHPLRGPGRSTVIVGKSVHNQRVERMWRDVYTGVLDFYYGIFSHLQSIHMLNPDNALHLFCLHIIYLPRINRHLKKHNLSPEQLWTSGLQRIAASGSHIAKEIFEDISEVGIYIQQEPAWTFSYARCYKVLSMCNEAQCSLCVLFCRGSLA